MNERDTDYQQIIEGLRAQNRLIAEDLNNRNYELNQILDLLVPKPSEERKLDWPAISAVRLLKSQADTLVSENNQLHQRLARKTSFRKKK
jgi:hypothetical protein